MKRICTRYCVYQILKIFPHHLWKQIWKLYFSQMCLEMLLKQLPSPSSSVAHRTWSPAAMEEEGGFPNRRWRRDFAATAQEVLFGHLEKLLHSESLCSLGTRCQGVLLSPSLVGQSLGWPAVKLGRAPLPQEVEEAGLWILHLQHSWGSVGSAPALNHVVREDTNILTLSLTLSQLNSPAGLLSKLQQPQDSRYMATSLSWAVATSVSFTPWRVLSPYPEALRKWFVPRCLSAVTPPSCSHTHPPLQKFALQSADQFSKVTQVVDKNPLKLLTKLQRCSLSVPWVLQATFPFLLQALRNQEEGRNSEATE